MAYAIMHFSRAERKSSTRLQSRLYIRVEAPCQKAKSFTRRPTTGGWQIVAIHDSKESWGRFRDSTLLPQMQKGIPGGFAGPPQENGFEVHNLQK